MNRHERERYAREESRYDRPRNNFNDDYDSNEYDSPRYARYGQGRRENYTEEAQGRDYGRYEQSRGYDYATHDQFGQSHYAPQSQYRSQRYGAGLTPGYYDNPNYESSQQRYGRSGYESGAQQGAYRNWTPQYQQQQYRNDPYDQRRADPHQSASYNPYQNEYGASRQAGYGYQGGYASDQGNYESPYRGQMAGENYPQQRYAQSNYGQQQYGQSNYGQQQYGQSNYGRPGENYAGGTYSQTTYGGGGGYGQSNYPQSNYPQTSNYAQSAYGQQSGVGTMGRSHTGRGPKGYKRSDDRIKEEVCDALMHAGHIDPSDIEVTVSEGEVTLKGNVCCRNDKRQVEDIAERVLGVQDVHTQLRIKKDKDTDNQSSYASGSTGYQSAGRSSEDTANGNKPSAQKESKYSTAGSNR